MNWKLLAAAVLMLVGVGAAVFVVVRPDLGATATSQYLTAAVTREDVAKNATASGTLSPHGIYGLAFGADPAPLSSTSTTSSGSSAASSGSGSGGTTWVVKTVATKVGDTVKAGQVLATADTSDAKLQVVIAQANLAAAKARLTVDQGGSQALVVAAARNQLAQSQLAYTTAQHTRQSTIQQNADAVTQAEQALTDAQAQLTTAKAGPTADVVTAAQDALAQAQLQYQSAVQAVAAQRTQNSQTVSQASDALTAAQDQLASAQAKMNIDQLALNNATAKLMSDTADKTTDPAVLAADQQAVTQATSAVNADQQAMTQAQAAITSAQNNLDATNTKVTGSGDQLDTQLTQAQQALTSAQHQYAAKIAPSQTSIDAANQAVQQAEQNLLVAKQKQASGVTQLADQLAQAQLQLAGAQNSYQQKIAPAAADQLASDKASIAQAEVNLASARNTLAHSVIVAPIDGTIVAVNIVPGVQAPSGYAITMLSGPFQVAADFTESDITTLAVGQPATVSISATGETAQGTVTQITPVAATSAGSSVVTYAVVVVLDPTPTSAMSGMSANVSITTASSPNTLAVPATAVVGRNGNYEVRVLDQAGQVSLVPVQIGLATNSLIEITSGLSEGETVVTGTSSTRQGTTATAGGGFGFPGLGGGGGEFRQRVGNGTNAGANSGAGAQTAPQP